jgi:hypothetical protein
LSALTIARAHPDSVAEGRMLTKIWRSPTEKPVTAPFPLLYRFEEREFDGLAGLDAILREIENDPSACIIRGRLKQGRHPNDWCPRRYKGPDAALTDVPGVYRLHLWFLLDRTLSSAKAKAWVESWNR